jgi:HSP20 family protein
VDPRGKERLEGLRRFQGEVDRMFLELMGADRMLGQVRSAFRPNVDVYFSKSQGTMMVKLDLAGIDPDTVHLEAEERILRISGHRIDQGHREKVYQQMEIAYGPFERRILLPVDVDPAGAEARYEQGFLEIRLPVAEKRAAQRIPITATDEGTERP